MGFPSLSHFSVKPPMVLVAKGDRCVSAQTNNCCAYSEEAWSGKADRTPFSICAAAKMTTAYPPLCLRLEGVIVYFYLAMACVRHFPFFYLMEELLIWLDTVEFRAH